MLFATSPSFRSFAEFFVSNAVPGDLIRGQFAIALQMFLYLGLYVTAKIASTVTLNCSP
ncbi:hypothetical protein CIP107570_00986 [Corynebacterium diphtheriae]|nr:hypothetical protein CIP107570_00986 [Corynebacterium diphtheriae]